MWRYLDFGKFVSMLKTGSIYFACTSELNDPFEGWLPRSHIDAFIKLNRATLDQMRSTRDSIAARYPDRDPAPLDLVVKNAEDRLNFQKLLQSVNLKFGVSCWHINEEESAAMWQLYGSMGSGIAIESTNALLEAELNGDGIVIDQVRYMDFDRDEIDKGHRHYGLFIKRKSFVHEQELRATILLPTPGKGALVKCDLNTMITKIHISPSAPQYYVDAVKYVVGHADKKIDAPVMASRLLHAPDY